MSLSPVALKPEGLMPRSFTAGVRLSAATISSDCLTTSVTPLMGVSTLTMSSASLSTAITPSLERFWLMICRRAMRPDRSFAPPVRMSVMDVLKTSWLNLLISLFTESRLAWKCKT